MNRPPHFALSDRHRFTDTLSWDEDWRKTRRRAVAFAACATLGHERHRLPAALVSSIPHLQHLQGALVFPVGGHHHRHFVTHGDTLLWQSHPCFFWRASI